MTDLELLDKYCEECLDFISPFIFRDVQSRGLYKYINYLPRNTAQAKATVRARLAADNKFFDDEETDGIANTIFRLNKLCEDLAGCNMADTHKTLPIIEELKGLTLHLADYYSASPFKTNK